MDRTQEQIAAELLHSLTIDYRGRNTNIGSDGLVDYQYDWDVDRMVKHPVVAEALRIQEAGISAAEFEPVDATNSQVGTWAEQALRRFWENDLYKVQLSYRRGWVGAEILYAERGSELAQVGLKAFHHVDARPLVHKESRTYGGVKVRNLDKGQAILKAGNRWPGRAFWHGHDLLTERFYGSGLLYSAHQDWQRLAERQGVEKILDQATIRTGVPGAEIYYDPESPAVRDPDTGQLSWSKGRELGRQMLNDMTAGMATCFPSSYDEKGNPKWKLNWPERVLNAQPLLDIIKHYESRICYGIGTPRELMESVDTGSWAGRNVSMETFLTCQMRYARQILTSVIAQILLPLARFHHGPDVHFAFRVKPLNQTRAANNQGEATTDPGQPGQEQNQGRPSQGGGPGEKPIGNSPPPTRSSFIQPGSMNRPRLLSTYIPLTRRIRASTPILLDTYQEHQHPRANDGKWTSKGRTGNTAAPKKGGSTKEANPFTGKAARRYKPQPEGWGEPVIPGKTPRPVWNIGTSGGYERAKPLIDEARRLYSNPEKVTIDEVRAFAVKILETTGRDALYTLAVATGIKTGTAKAIAERVTEGLTSEPLDLPEVDQTKDLQLQRKARDMGATPREAKEITSYARMLRDEGNRAIDYRNNAIRYAFQALASHNQGEPVTRAHKAFNGGDYNEINGFDVVAREVNSHYPGVFGTDSKEGSVSNDYDMEKLFSMMSDGIQPRLTLLDTFQEAFSQFEATPKQETPF